MTQPRSTLLSGTPTLLERPAPPRWRLCFRWTRDGPEDVEIVDYH